MTNALRITLGLMAAIAMVGCQKNADKLGTSVRGRSSSVGVGSASTYTTNYNTQVSNAQPVYNLITSEVGQGGYSQVQGVNTTIRMCNSVHPATSQTLTPFTATNAQMEIDVYDAYSPSTGAIVTKLPFISGYTQILNGYTYITAEFGDGSGNIAFNGYLDQSGNLVNGMVYEDTFAVDGSLQAIGSVSLAAASWIVPCAQ